MLPYNCADEPRCYGSDFEEKLATTSQKTKWFCDVETDRPQYSRFEIHFYDRRLGEGITAFVKQLLYILIRGCHLAR